MNRCLPPAKGPSYLKALNFRTSSRCAQGERPAIDSLLEDLFLFDSSRRFLDIHTIDNGYVMMAYLQMDIDPAIKRLDQFLACIFDCAAGRPKARQFRN